MAEQWCPLCGEVLTQIRAGILAGLWYCDCQNNKWIIQEYRIAERDSEICSVHGVTWRDVWLESIWADDGTAIEDYSIQEEGLSQE